MNSNSKNIPDYLTLIMIVLSLVVIFISIQGYYEIKTINPVQLKGQILQSKAACGGVFFVGMLLLAFSGSNWAKGK